MSTLSRGVLAFVGLVTAFFTLVFLSQMFRYLNLALLGDQLAIGMFAAYVISSFLGVSITALAFRPEESTATYASGVGVGVGGLLALASLYLFTSSLTNGMFLLIFAGIQFVAVGAVYGGSRVLREERSSSGQDAVVETEGGSEAGEAVVNEVEPETESEVRSQSEREVEPSSTPAAGASRSVEPETESSESMGSKVGRWAQNALGAGVFLLGVIYTSQDPVWFPMMLVGLAIIPDVRSSVREAVGR